MSSWQLGGISNATIAVAYVAIAALIGRGLLRHGNWRGNPLAIATGLIFLSCGIGHALHARHLIFPMDHAGMAGMAAAGGMRAGWSWDMALWDSLTACVAVAYLTLRGRYGTLLSTPEMFRAEVERATEAERLAARAALAESEARHRTIVESLHEGVVLQGGDGTILAANARAAQLLGLTPDQLRGRTSLDPRWRAVHEDGSAWPGADHPVPRALRTGEPVGPEVMGVHTPLGELRWLEVHATPLRDGDGQVTGAVASFVDVTGSRASERALRRSEQELRSTLDGLAEGVILLDARGEVAAVNAAARAMGAFMGPGAPGTSIHDGLVLRDLEGRRLEREELPSEIAARTGEAVRGFRVEGHRPGDPPRWLDVSALPVPGEQEDGRHAVVVSFADVTELVERWRALVEARRRAQATFDNAPIGMAVADVDGVVLEANATLGELLGRPASEVVGEDALDMIHPSDRRRARRGRDAVVAGERATVRMQGRLVRADGEALWAQLDCTALPDADGEISKVIVQLQDVSERRAQEEHLRHLADHDALTGLLNRRALSREVVRHLERTARYGATGALLLLDLDGFKEVNDTHGHATGDRLIVAVGALLRERLRRSDCLARLGGDEFAVLLPQGDASEATVVAEGLVEALHAARHDLPGAEATPVRASVGVAAVGPGMGHDELFAEADAAMYAAKDAGGDRVALAREVAGA